MTPLHNAGDSIRQALQAIPLTAVRLLFVVSLLVMLIWVIRLPREDVTPPGGARRWDENLKIGAGAALLIQIVLYSLF